MSVSAACRGCGRVLRFPDGTKPDAARCPSCRAKKPATKVEPVFSLDPEPEPVAQVPKLARLAQIEPEPPPSWLVAVGGLFALALWAGPVAVSRAAGVNFGLGMLIGGLLAASVLVGNALIVFHVRVADGMKVALLAGVAFIGMGTFFAGAYVASPQDSEETVEAPASPVDTLLPAPPVVVPPSQPVPPIEPVSTRPTSHIDLAYRDGMTRLEDGPAAVTALALSPLDGWAVVGFADGSTRIVALDQATFEAPRIGPKGDGAVRRIQFDGTGRIVYLTCENGFFAAQLYNPSAHPLKIPGERVVVYTEPKGDRFAAVRGTKLLVRYVPTDLVKNPPAIKATDRFVVSPPKSEVLPAGMKPEYPVPDANPTFLAWHPNGQLIWGKADGAIRAWSATNAKLDDLTKEHKGAVRAWAMNGTDFATGDDKGGIGYWRNKAAKPTMYWNGSAAITQLAFAGWGAELIVADAAGGLSCWDVAIGKRVFEITRPTPVTAVSYGPADDLLLLPDGNGVHVWWIPALIAKSKK